MMAKDKPFRSINLPTKLVNKIEELIKKPEVIHRTKASFIEYAIRKHIEYIEQKEKTYTDLQQALIDFMKYVEDHSKKD